MIGELSALRGLCVVARVILVLSCGSFIYLCVWRVRVAMYLFVLRIRARVHAAQTLLSKEIAHLSFYGLPSDAVRRAFVLCASVSAFTEPACVLLLFTVSVPQAGAMAWCEYSSCFAKKTFDNGLGIPPKTGF